MLSNNIKILVLILGLISPMAAAVAQINVAASKAWLYKTKDDEEWFDSEFPLISTARRNVDDLMNNALQAEVLGMVLNDKNFKIATAKGRDPDWNFGYRVYTNVPRLLMITITSRHVYSTMSIRSDDKNMGFYFDLKSGKRVWIKELFSESGYVQLKSKLTAGFTNAIKAEASSLFADSKGNITEPDDKKSLDDCVASMPQIICNEQFVMTPDQGNFIFGMGNCRMMNPGPSDEYRVTISAKDLKPMLSPYGKYLMFGEAEVSSGTVYGMWKGTISTIPFTFSLAPTCSSNEVSGTEFYDKQGISLHIDGKFDRNQIVFNEYDKGKIVGTLAGVIDGNTMSGTWTKGDKSKTLPFKATLLGAQ